MSISEQIVISCNSEECERTIVLPSPSAGPVSPDAPDRATRIDEALAAHAWSKLKVATGTQRTTVHHCQIHSKEIRMLLGEADTVTQGEGA